MKIAGSGTGSGSDPDPYQNVTDPQHCLRYTANQYEEWLLWLGMLANNPATNS
jgi:hypothetical protein